jgi:hypothetical protein
MVLPLPINVDDPDATHFAKIENGDQTLSVARPFPVEINPAAYSGSDPRSVRCAA